MSCEYISRFCGGEDNLTMTHMRTYRVMLNIALKIPLGASVVVWYIFIDICQFAKWDPHKELLIVGSIYKKFKDLLPPSITLYVRITYINMFVPKEKS